MSVHSESVAPGSLDYPPPPRSEAYWPPLLTIATVIVLQLVLPDRLIPVSRWLLPALEVVVLAVLAFISPARVYKEHTVRRRLAIGVTALVSLGNGLNLVLLADNLLHHHVTQGKTLIIAGMLIWITNVLLFSLWYWEADRGGPGKRAAGRDGPPDLLFPQMNLPGLTPGWRPKFADYMYVSLTNAAAFSPTDTMPLSVMLKGIMGVQSLISLVTIGLVVSRAVNIL